MKAVILAAGRGTRLDAITRNKPKCLVHVNSRCILDRQLEALLAIEAIEQVVIVCGYHAQQVKTHVSTHYADDSRVFCLENKLFATTNNMYSLHMTRDLVAGHDVILMNADVVFDPSIIEDLAATNHGSICVQAGAYQEESMKVIGDNDRLTAISKTISSEHAYGVSIDVYKFTSSDMASLLSEVHAIVEQTGDVNAWTEVAMDQLMKTGVLSLRPFDIEDRFWFEIDNLEDLLNAERLSGHRELDWTSIKAAFVDMDGTLYCGNTPIPGAASFFKTLVQTVPHVYLLSNNSSRSHADYQAHLADMGISVDVTQILLSTDALCAYLNQRSINKVYAVGTASFIDTLATHGICHDPDHSTTVVLGYDTELTYQKLKHASLLLHDRNIEYIATHSDLVCPTEAGDIPDIGATIALIETTTGRRPDRIFGKPGREMVAHIFDSLAISPEACVFIGDRVYTDYKMAHNCGAQFVGVLSGDSNRIDFESCEAITIFPSVTSIFENGCRQILNKGTGTDKDQGAGTCTR